MLNFEIKLQDKLTT